MKISICIPAFNRLDYLKKSLESCFNQTFKPFEIIIGDDSTNDEIEKYLKNLIHKSPIPIFYFHHIPSLRQAKNINFIFQEAKGDKVLLLHDDDLLIPNCLEIFINTFNENPQIKIIFGKQYIINENDKINYELSEAVNNYYYRNTQYEGSSLPPLSAAVLQQFPNDAYIIERTILNKINYRTHYENYELGNGCEYDFGIRLGFAGYRQFFVNTYTAKYRIAENSMSKSGSDSGYKAYKILEHVYKNVKSVHKQTLKKGLQRKARIAIMQAAELGLKKDALKIFFGPFHRNEILTASGLKAMWKICIK